jgi:eukaryotic-like serine/threonine-protein kinase
MKNLTLIFCILTICGLSEQAFAQSKAKTQTHTWLKYEAVKEKLTVEYPADWELDTTRVMNTTFILKSPKENTKDEFQENINLLVQDLAGYNLDLAKFTEITESQIQQMLAESKILMSAPVHFLEMPAHQLSYSGKFNNVMLKWEQIFWIEGEKAFILSYSAKIEAFEKYHNTVEQIINSIKRR